MANDQGLGFTLSRRAQLSPDSTALIFREEQWTYRELNHLTNKVAHGLHALGVNPGDRVGFLGLNHPRFFFTLFAAAKLDAIFVPLNFRLTGPELSFIIRDAGLHTLVYEEGFAAIVNSIRGDLNVREYVCAVEQPEARGFEVVAPRPARHGPRLSGRHDRRRADHVHVGDDGQAEGGNADPRQHHLEQHQRVPRR